MDEFGGLWFNCENVKTVTSEEQCDCEKICSEFLKPLCTYTGKVRRKLRGQCLANQNDEVCLLRKAHVDYLTSGLEKLSGGFISLDASRPWICYWICHALYLLHCEPVHLYPRVVSTLSCMQNVSGGYGGGPGQLSHAAPNYAAVLTLCTIGTTDALQSIDRPAMYHYFMSLKAENGGFRMHKDGEVDSRGTYTVISIARLLNILTDELCDGVDSFVLQCQTYEGGFGGEPFNEAHGGYNFCALATLVILGAAGRCDLKAQEHWLLHRQMKLEGGFQGRTNKLVDSCYSFWQGAALAMVEMVKDGGGDTHDMDLYFQEISESDSRVAAATSAEAGSGKGPAVVDDADDVDDIVMEETARIQIASSSGGVLPFNQQALQRYILHCAQNAERGGLQDKPGKPRDFYHSCYALSGLSISQSCMATSSVPSSRQNEMQLLAASFSSSSNQAHRPIDFRWTGAQVYGDVNNLLEPTSAIFNIGLRKLRNVLSHFKDRPSTHSELVASYNNFRV